MYYHRLSYAKIHQDFHPGCDALGKHIGVVLMQEGFPLTFTGKQLYDSNLANYTHEK